LWHDLHNELFFRSGSDKIQLAILHPQKLAIYAVSKLPGQVEHGSQFKVTLYYEHQLKRHAYNMCVGPFGHDTNPPDPKTKSNKSTRDFICVQSLDGTLSFFEQEVFTFSRYLPGFLLPGALAYVPVWDSFLTACSWNLQCFKYSAIAMSKDSNGNDKTNDSKQLQDTAVGKRLTSEWNFFIGEEPIGDLQVLQDEQSPNETTIIVATFRHIFCIGISAQLVWSKRLDYQISTMHAFKSKNAKIILW